jgi:hypothetical protein
VALVLSKAFFVDFVTFVAFFVIVISKLRQHGRLSFGVHATLTADGFTNGLRRRRMPHSAGGRGL